MKSKKVDSFDDLAAQVKRLHGDVTFELQRRERPDRHPYQVGILFGLLIIALCQIILGLPPQSALYDTVNYTTLVALNTPFIVGSTLALSGAALSRATHFVLSVRLGMFGHLSTLAASAMYSVIVIVSTDNPGGKPYWIAVTSVGMSLGLVYASVARFLQMRSLLRQYRQRRT